MTKILTAFAGLAGLGILALSTPVIAASFLVSGAKVTLIEATPMPASFGFQIDKAVGACPAGTFLNYFAQGADANAKTANAMANYSAVLTAFSAGKSLELGVDDSNCSVHVIQVW